MKELAKSEFQITGRHVLLAALAFFLTVTAVNGLMMFKAITTFGGLDTPDAYRKGLAYNQRIAASEAQMQMGWTEAISLDKARNVLSVVLTDRDGSAINDLNVTAKIGRPATNVFDAEVLLEAQGNGRYEVAATELGAGTWTVDISARYGAGDKSAIVYQSKARIWK